MLDFSKRSRREHIVSPTTHEAFSVYKYACDNMLDDLLISRFAALTVWRALHAMALNGKQSACNFLASPERLKLDAKSIELLQDKTLQATTYQFPAQFDFLSLRLLFNITGSSTRCLLHGHSSRSQIKKR